MPTIFGWDNERVVTDIKTNRVDDSRAFRTDALIVRDALREYEEHLNVKITPQPPQPQDVPDQSSRFVIYRRVDGNEMWYCVLAVERDGEASFEIGQDFDFVLRPDDILSVSITAC